MLYKLDIFLACYVYCTCGKVNKVRPLPPVTQIHNIEEKVDGEFRYMCHLRFISTAPLKGELVFLFLVKLIKSVRSFIRVNRLCKFNNLRFNFKFYFYLEIISKLNAKLKNNCTRFFEPKGNFLKIYNDGQWISRDVNIVRDKNHNEAIAL